MAAAGACAAVVPSGSPQTARSCCSNWQVTWASMVRCPELCGRGASSLTITEPSRVTNSSTHRTPTTSSASQAARATSTAFAAVAADTRAEDAEEAWSSIGRKPAVLEAVIDFACEVSVVVARSADGTMVDYGAIENSHRHHILDVSVWPARIPEATAGKAVTLARAACEALDVVGVLCVEMFVDAAGDVIVNELAPRPHNSGHLTIDAHVTCQFEQQLRAVCGLPLGTTTARAPAAAMANLLGDEWAGVSRTGQRRSRCPGSSCTSTASSNPARAERWGI